MAALDDPTVERVIKVLEGLPVLPEQRARIPALARELVFVSWLARLGDNPRGRTSGSKKAASDLERVRDQLIKVADGIAALGREATVLLDLARTSEARTKTIKSAAARRAIRLREDVLCSEAFEVHARAMAEVAELGRAYLVARPKPWSAKKPRLHRASETAQVALNVFERLTGKQATVTVRGDRAGNPTEGPFLDFLNEIFKALAIRASAASQAKTAIKTKRAGKKTT